jgi:tetraacyldisaccharide 4'-kinase
VAAAKALLAANPACDVVISDDGLQHYRLARDFEIAVIDGERGLGNGLMLPAGPLREPSSRLASVDAVVVNGGSAEAWPNAYAMRLHGREFHNLLEPGRRAEPAHFANQRVLAIAGIGNPARFFAHLDALGVKYEARAFPDHHAYRESDLDRQGADVILMTEKDAVKCAAFAAGHMWMLPVEAAPDPHLGAHIVQKLKLDDPK